MRVQGSGFRVQARRGITLLEVLISIGVLSVGVLGAATLLPMATYFQNETTKYDRGGALAQQAVHDIQIKNYLSPRRWIFLDPAAPVVTNPVGIAGLVTSSSYNPFSAIVIDPLGFSYVAAQTPAVAGFPCYFPAFPNQGGSSPGTVTGQPVAPTIYRAGVTSNDYWPPAATIPVASPIIMPFSVADRMMRSSDDVLFDTPTNTDLRPVSVSGTSMPSFAGDFSWIATVSRTPGDMSAGIATGAQQNAGVAAAAQMHRFQVSVVVLQKRDVTLWAAGLTPEKPPPERQVFALFTQYGGQAVTSTAPFYGGGGLQLYVYETSQTPGVGQPSRHWLDNIKPNTYLMLAANFADGLVGANGAVYPRLAWFRILNVDDGPTQDLTFSAAGSANTRWYRNLTVAGNDWPAMSFEWPIGSGTLNANWVGADPTAPNATMPANTAAAATPTAAPVTFCTLMDDAIAEFDQNITLDYSLVRQ